MATFGGFFEQYISSMITLLHASVCIFQVLIISIIEKLPYARAYVWLR